MAKKKQEYTLDEKMRVAAEKLGCVYDEIEYIGDDANGDEYFESPDRVIAFVDNNLNVYINS